MDSYESRVVAFKAHMFLFSMILADLSNHEKYRQVLMSKPLPTKIPIYENRSYLLYLALLTPYLPLSSSSSSLTLLHTLLQLLSNEKQRQALVKEYEDEIYCQGESNN